MRVALFFDGFDAGGIGKVNLLLAESLLHQNNSVDLLVFSDGGPRKNLIPEGARVVNLENSKKICLLRKLIAYMSDRHPDVVYVSNVILAVTVACARFFTRCQCRVVGIQHTNIEHNLAVRSTFYRLFVRYALRFATAFLDLKIAAVSEGLALAVARCTGVKSEAVSVLYNPVSLEQPSTGLTENLRNWWDGGSCKLLCVTRLIPEKDPRTLLDAIVKLKEGHDPRLVIVGPGGAYLTEVNEMIANRNVSNNVVLAGFHANPAAFFEHTDILVSSSRSEAWSLTLVEAMSAGKQVVSTDCDYGPREILENGKWGKLVSVGDANALCEAIKDSMAHPTPPEKLKQRAGLFTPELVVKQYLELLECPRSLR